MRTFIHYAGVIVLASWLLLSCSNTEQPPADSARLSANQSTAADTSLSGLIGLVSTLKGKAPFSGNKLMEKQLEKMEKILLTLKSSEPGYNKTKSGPISYESFLKRRQQFIDTFAILIKYKTFPTFFQISRNSIDSLYKFGQLPNHDTLTAVRMYPVYDERLVNSTKYSWAFMWADTADPGYERFNKELIMDIINPCPPPYDCH